MAAGKPDYYDILGVAKGAPADEIKKAYRKQALEWHPDKHQKDKEVAEKRFKEINEAYQILSDPKKKQAYDQFGHQAFSSDRGANPFGQAGRSGPFTYTYTTSGQQNPFGSFDFGDPFEIFEQFFGGGQGFNRAASIPRYSISIDFNEAVTGVEKHVSINGKKRSIKIPAGVDDGSRIKFDDFILSVDVHPHEFFERDGADIYMRKEVPLSMAVLGGTIEVPTVDSKVKLKIRKGTQSGTMIRLRGQGMPYLGRSGRGDQYVKLVVSVPKKLSRDQKKLFENLKKEGL